MSDRFVIWKVTDKYGNIECTGVSSNPLEFDLDILPGGWCGDRPAWKVQKTMEKTKLWSENGYVFEHKLCELHDDLTITDVKI